MMAKKTNYSIPLDEQLKREAKAKSALSGIPLTAAIRAFLSALARGDKRAQSIIDESSKKK